MSPEEWDDLPWWQERMYIEGFGEEEFVELDGTEFDAEDTVADSRPFIGPDPLDRALAGTVRRRAKKLE